MKILIFGATGMIGQSVQREGILSNEVLEILIIGRKGKNQHHEKLQEIKLCRSSKSMPKSKQRIIKKVILYLLYLFVVLGNRSSKESFN